MSFLQDSLTNPKTTSIYNTSEVKFFLEDAIQQIFNKDLKYKQNTSYEDRYLILGYAASAFALYGAVYGYLNKFYETLDVTLLCVIGYFILSGLATAHEKWIKKDVIYMGKKKDPLGLDPPQTIIISTKFPKYSSDFTISMQISSKKKSANVSMTKSIGDWFDSLGQLDSKKFYSDLTGLLQAKVE